jgi:hypothetical protein
LRGLAGTRFEDLPIFQKMVEASKALASRRESRHSKRIRGLGIDDKARDGLAERERTENMGSQNERATTSQPERQNLVDVRTIMAGFSMYGIARCWVLFGWSGFASDGFSKERGHRSFSANSRQRFSR